MFFFFCKLLSSDFYFFYSEIQKNLHLKPVFV